jgi:hypothetical protein
LEGIAGWKELFDKFGEWYPKELQTVLDELGDTFTDFVSNNKTYVAKPNNVK